MSVLLPVSDVVIEYRATVGRYAERRNNTTIRLIWSHLVIRYHQSDIYMPFYRLVLIENSKLFSTMGCVF